MAMAHRSLKRRREALPPSDSVEEATPFEEEEEVAKERMKKKMPFFFLLVLFLSGGRFHATGLATKSIMDFESKKILVSVSFGVLKTFPLSRVAQHTTDYSPIFWSCGKLSLSLILEGGDFAPLKR